MCHYLCNNRAGSIFERISDHYAIYRRISTTLSHISAYTILENIRLSLAQRLMKAPLGTVLGESVGKLKNVLVDRVETIELPLAHMIPECISNLLLPIAVFIYLVCVDWRMALSMLTDEFWKCGFAIHIFRHTSRWPIALLQRHSYAAGFSNLFDSVPWHCWPTYELYYLCE